MQKELNQMRQVLNHMYVVGIKLKTLCTELSKFGTDSDAVQQVLNRIQQVLNPMQINE